MFRKVLVANRGEIAVRAFRAATELGARTVAVFPYEDRKSEHRLKADEAYQIGEEGHPVRAYLDHEAIVAQAVEAGADAIYPGYGFLSENPGLAEACERAGITFVGPPPSVLHLTGNKARALAAAREAGLPTLRGSAATADLAELEAAAAEIGFPLFVKAVVRRRRPRDAARRPSRAARRRAPSRSAGGRVRLRRPDALPRGVRAAPPAHRGPGPGRCDGTGRPPLRARLLGAAPAPEGRRDRPRPEPRSGTARPALCGRRRTSRGRSATGTPARSSSSSATTIATSSSR